MRVLISVTLLCLFVSTQERETHRAPAAIEVGDLVYDEARRQLLMIGAYELPTPPETAALWSWRDGRWNPQPLSAAPSMRTLSVAAYDARRHRVVLFGGVGNAGYADLRGDTWEWDGTRWERRDEGGAGTRDHHAMAYDAARGVMVMYGGVASDRSLPRDTWVHPEDVWEWDGDVWTKRMSEPNPGPRIGHAMAHDSARGRVVLFGGMGKTPGRLDDTWSWDGSAWTHHDVQGPPARSNHAMSFDPTRGAIVVWGGAGAGGHLDDMWQWDGRAWTEVAQGDVRPPPRSGAQMVYDTARRRLVLAGGYVRENGRGRPAGDMWEWDGVRWTPSAVR